MATLNAKVNAAARALFAGRGRVLVAVSGGADSVALLLALHGLRRALGLRLTVAHLNHGIRGRAAAEDADFVRRLARRLRLPCAVGRVSVPARARRAGVSLEMAARKARYAFLARAARRCGAQAIATAHTADDQAETLVLRLARGAGPRGLAGIRRIGTRQGLPVLRPLLDATRSEVEAFLRARGETWHEDETNADPAFLRNRVRREILPLLERRLNPRIRQALCRTAELQAAEEDWLEALAAESLARARAPDAPGALRIAPLQALPAAARRRVLRRWLLEEGAPAESLEYESVARMERLLAPGARGAAVAPAGPGSGVRRRYGRLALVPRKPRRPAPRQAVRVRLAVPGETRLAERGLRVRVTLEPGIVRPPRTQPGHLPATASIARAAVGRRALYLRAWRPGDRMRPLGMQGSRKLHDIFIDAKVPAEARAAVPVLECGGDIVWLPGYRIARGWELPDPQAPAVRITIAPA